MYGSKALKSMTIACIINSQASKFWQKHFVFNEEIWSRVSIFWQRLFRSGDCLGKCVWWKITNELVCFMAIDRLEIKSLLLHGIVFDCVMAVVEQVVNALRQEIVRGHLFSLWFFSGTWRQQPSMLFDSWGRVHFFVFCSEWQSELLILGWGDFQKLVVCNSNPGANPCSGVFLALCWLVWLLMLCCRCPIADWWVWRPDTQTPGQSAQSTLLSDRCGGTLTAVVCQSRLNGGRWSFLWCYAAIGSSPTNPSCTCISAFKTWFKGVRR